MHHCKSTSILWSINAYLSEVHYFLFIPKDKKSYCILFLLLFLHPATAKGIRAAIHSFHSAVSEKATFAYCFKSLQSFP